MIVPNKVVRFNESIIGKMLIILEKLTIEEETIENLYLDTQNYFEDIDEFIYSLDVLYLLDAIQLDFNRGVVNYVKAD
jgi:hypothetical protein